jgi:hypothetical protein
MSLDPQFITISHSASNMGFRNMGGGAVDGQVPSHMVLVVLLTFGNRCQRDRRGHAHKAGIFKSVCNYRRIRFGVTLSLNDTFHRLEVGWC